MILIKSDREIDGIRKSCKLAAESLKMIEPYVIPGVSTRDLNNLLNQFIIERGGIAAPFHYLGYPRETCISLNEVICHGIPSKRRLRNGDILNVDVTTILNGFYGDTSKMFTVGEVSEEAKNLIQVTKECLDLGIKQVRPGIRTGIIGCEISKYAESRGYSVVHQFCAHGVGINFHEEPQICHKSNPNDGVIMQEGMTFTIEPMINLGVAEAIIDKTDRWTARTADGKLSAQFEHTILVTENGHEILTQLEDK